MTVIHITRGPSFVSATALDDRETRWCFACRKHFVHTWALLEDPPEDGPSWYDPHPVCRCSRCGKDETHHPGSCQEGPSMPSEAVWAALVADRKAVLEMHGRKS